MADFFGARTSLEPSDDRDPRVPRGARGPRPGLAVFLNAGDPPLDRAADVITMLDDARVDVLELAVPFPDSVTDGPVIRRSAARALERGVGLDETLDLVAAVRPRLRHLRIAVFADWSHTVRPRSMGEVVARLAGSGADGILVHALPPRLHPAYIESTAEAALPVVATCYAGSTPEVRAAAAADATAYLYLVAHYGRSGRRPPGGYDDLAGVIAELKAAARVPLAVGFGVRTAADVQRIGDLGADGAVVGSAVVARIESAQAAGDDVATVLRPLLDELRDAPSPRSDPLTDPSIPDLLGGTAP